MSFRMPALAACLFLCAHAHAAERYRVTLLGPRMSGNGKSAILVTRQTEDGPKFENLVGYSPGRPTKKQIITVTVEADNDEAALRAAKRLLPLGDDADGLEVFKGEAGLRSLSELRRRRLRAQISGTCVFSPRTARQLVGGQPGGLKGWYRAQGQGEIVRNNTRLALKLQSGPSAAASSAAKAAIHAFTSRISLDHLSRVQRRVLDELNEKDFEEQFTEFKRKERNDAQIVGGEFVPYLNRDLTLVSDDFLQHSPTLDEKGEKQLSAIQSLLDTATSDSVRQGIVTEAELLPLREEVKKIYEKFSTKHDGKLVLALRQSGLYRLGERYFEALLTDKFLSTSDWTPPWRYLQVDPPEGRELALGPVAGIGSVLYLAYEKNGTRRVFGGQFNGILQIPYDELKRQLGDPDAVLGAYFQQCYRVSDAATGRRIHAATERNSAQH